MVVRINQQMLRDQLLACQEDYLSLEVLEKYTTFEGWLKKKRLAKNLASCSGVVREQKLKRYESDFFAEKSLSYRSYIDGNMDRLYQIYERSLGMHSQLSGPDSEPSLRLKILIHEDTRRDVTSTLECHNFGVLTERSSGCMLNFAKWDLMVNDIVFLAAVHDGHDIAVFEPTKTLAPAALWSVEDDRLRVTGRELALLQCARYQRCGWSIPILSEEVYFCPPEEILPITLKDICQAASEIRDVAQVESFARTVTKAL